MQQSIWYEMVFWWPAALMYKISRVILVLLPELKMFSFLARYMALVGVLANAAAAAFLMYWFAGKVSDTEFYRDTRRWFFGSADGVELTTVKPVAPGVVNPELRSLPAGVWLKIHQQTGSGPDDFSRQSHGGAAFDPVRGRLMLFGSDTHSTDWDNTVRFFDMGSLHWSSAYPPDDRATYRVNPQGIPVAGSDGERPWAMHTFDAVEFDPISDRLIVASHPEHLSPAKPWGIKKQLWKQIESHPTWAYLVSENSWQPLANNGVSFFPYGATFDLNRRVYIGVKSTGYWVLDIDTGRWEKIGKGGPPGWHNAATFDSDREVVVSFGTNKGADEVWQYRLGEERDKLMPTPGVRPPGGGSTPLVYHPGIKRVVALIERKKAGGPGSTETWLYSTAEDAWRQVPTASIPFAIGMNYDMVYDPNHELLVLVANYLKEPVAVWVLRLE